MLDGPLPLVQRKAAVASVAPGPSLLETMSDTVDPAVAALLGPDLVRLAGAASPTAHGSDSYDGSSHGVDVLADDDDVSATTLRLLLLLLSLRSLLSRPVSRAQRGWTAVTAMALLGDSPAERRKREEVSGARVPSPVFTAAHAHAAARRLRAAGAAAARTGRGQAAARARAEEGAWTSRSARLDGGH
jgi:hypothetical protein